MKKKENKFFNLGNNFPFNNTVIIIINKTKIFFDIGTNWFATNKLTLSSPFQSV